VKRKRNQDKRNAAREAADRILLRIQKGSDDICHKIYADKYACIHSFFYELCVTCPTDGGRGASLVDWAAIGMKGTFYGRQKDTIETLQ
jgi:hypothetical protein